MLHMFKKIMRLLKSHWANLLSIFFIWVVPILMLNEVIAFVQVGIAFKITFAGCLVMLLILWTMKNKINCIIEKQPHGVVRGVLLCLHKTMIYGLILGVVWAIHAFSENLISWWLLCGISWGIGFVFLIVNENKRKG